MRVVTSRVVGIGLVVGVLFVLGAVGLWRMNDTPNRSAEARIELLQRYDRSFVELWVRGCVSSGETVAFCRCAIDEYTSRLQPFEFETAAVVAQSGGEVAELPENVRTAVEDVERECR